MMARPVRVAAVGDLHMGEDLAGKLRGHFAHLDDDADLLVLAGDLTRCGTVDEARLLCDELADVHVPIFAVLGNHDLHADDAAAVILLLQARGVQVLEGAATTVTVRGTRVAVAGTVGFGHGFLGGAAAEFGEQVMKDFVGRAKLLAAGLDHALAAVRADLTVVVTHYSPIEETLGAEPREIYPFLGSYLLAEVADRHDVDLYLHGHAHRGAEFGTTPGGVAVRNVAQPVIECAYRVYELDPDAPGAGPGLAPASGSAQACSGDASSTTLSA